MNLSDLISTRDIDWSNPVAVTGATTLQIGKHHVMTGSTADYTVTLPPVSGNAGKLVSVEMSAALTKLVTIDGNGAETIDGTASRVMWAKETAVLLSNGTTWTKVGGKSIPMTCQITKATAQTGISSAVLTKATLDTYSFGLSQMADTANNRILIARPSNYIVSGGFIGNAIITVTPYTVQAMIKQNGNQVANNQLPLNLATTSYPVMLMPYGLIDAAQNDYIELFMLVASSGTWGTFGSNTDKLNVTEVVKW